MKDADLHCASQYVQLASLGGRFEILLSWAPGVVPADEAGDQEG